MLKWTILSIVSITLALFAATGHAQQPSPSDLADALAYKNELFQSSINRAVLDVVAMKRQAESFEARLKYALDNWVPKSAAAEDK